MPSPGETQISAYVSSSTKEQLDRYADAHGIKQGRLIEDALRHHLSALRELPADIVIPTRIVVTAKSGKKLLSRLRNPKPPTRAMRALFKTR